MLVGYTHALLHHACPCVQFWLSVFWYYHHVQQWAYDMQLFDTLDNFLTRDTYA